MGSYRVFVTQADLFTPLAYVITDECGRRHTVLANQIRPLSRMSGQVYVAPSANNKEADQAVS